MKAWWIAAGVGAVALVGGGIVYAMRSGGTEVPPKPEGLTKYDSEAFEHRGFVIVIDRRNPDTNPRKWRWRVFDRDAYGDGGEIEGKQRATEFGQTSRARAYKRAVAFIDDKIVGGG